MAANLFQDAEESEAATKFCETSSGQDDMPDLWMLRYENFDPPKEPINETKKKLGLVYSILNTVKETEGIFVMSNSDRS